MAESFRKQRGVGLGTGRQYDAQYVLDPVLYPDISHHRDAIEARFKIEQGYVSEALTALTGEKDVVFVCFSNRSGSNLLLDALGRIGFGCEPGDEFFNAESVADHASEFMFTRFEQYLEYIMTIRGFRDCVFLKIGPHQLFWLANSGLLGKYFARARYVLIERKDSIAQAVSLYIADQTGVYLKPSTQGENDVRRNVEYSKEGIMKRLKHVFDVGTLFRYFFTLHSLRYHHVWYEQIDADPVETLKEMARELSIEGRFPHHWELVLKSQGATIVRQANKLNERLIAEFGRDFELHGPREEGAGSGEQPR